MELIIICLIGIVVTALLVNKWLTLRYGAVPNKDLLYRVAELERIDTAKLTSHIDEIDSKLSLQIKALNKRIDGFVIGKVVQTNGYSVKSVD